MDSPKVSIVVPVYNVEKYLPRCLDSLARQTYQNLEIILVDDGSTDNSGALCDQFAEGRENVKVVHQENQGQSVARNYGVSIASGEYIAFSDSDDYVSDDYIEYMVRILNQYSADMAVLRSDAFIGESYTKNVGNEEDNKVLDTVEALRRLCYRRPFGISPCAKLYKREMVLRHPFPIGVFHEDVEPAYQIMAECKIVAYGSRISYFYRQHQNSSTHQKISDKDLYGITAARNLYEFMELNYPQLEGPAKYFAVTKLMEFIPKILNSDDKETFKTIKDELSKYSSSIMTDSNAKMTMKARCISVKLGYGFSKVFFKIFESAKKRYITN